MQFPICSRTPLAIPCCWVFFFCSPVCDPNHSKSMILTPGVLLELLTGVPAVIADQDERASPLQDEPLLFPILAS
jgi:hypothetical protein